MKALMYKVMIYVYTACSLFYVASNKHGNVASLGQNAVNNPSNPALQLFEQGNKTMSLLTTQKQLTFLSS